MLAPTNKLMNISNMQTGSINRMVFWSFLVLLSLFFMAFKVLG